MSVEDFIIYVYCCVDAICRTIVKQPLRSRGFMPAEVITMEHERLFTRAKGLTLCPEVNL